jgi:hypothetical protein
MTLLCVHVALDWLHSGLLMLWSVSICNHVEAQQSEFTYMPLHGHLDV